MSQVFFILILILCTLVRPALSILAVVLRPLVPFIKKRLDFERKNFLEESSIPHRSADYCFEISSEGELEQVRTLLEVILNSGKKIEILYSSPSVEVKCQNLYKLYPEQVRLLRMPLLSSFPFSFLYFQSIWQWVKSPVVIFCRYDFFPELMLLKIMGKKFILLSGAMKKRSRYKDQCFRFFNLIVAATDNEKMAFTEFLGAGVEVYSCDFRVPRIAQRGLFARELLSKKTSLKSYLEKLEKLPPSEKIILGSAWVSDLAILNNPELIAKVKSGKLHILIAPHKIDNESSLAIKNAVEELFSSQYVELVNDEFSYKGGHVVILQMGGILCELYSYFNLAYVGGGYERSIHSVLEPFFSSNMVVTGPSVKRSTEFDLIKEIAPDEIHVLNSPESFYTIIESADLKSLNLVVREDFKARAQVEMKLIIEKILGQFGINKK